jgi:hypothetical protein
MLIAAISQLQTSASATATTHAIQLPKAAERLCAEKLNMDVFISWHGSHSKQIAETLFQYLALMINAIQPWLFSADIEAALRLSTATSGIMPVYLRAGRGRP